MLDTGACGVKMTRVCFIDDRRDAMNLKVNDFPGKRRSTAVQIYQNTYILDVLRWNTVRKLRTWTAAQSDPVIVVTVAFFLTIQSG